jgi:hypothetical protein
LQWRVIACANGEKQRRIGRIFVSVIRLVSPPEPLLDKSAKVAATPYLLQGRQKFIIVGTPPDMQKY